MKITRLVAVTILVLLVSSAARAASITTLFASNNGGADGGAVYFDLTVFGNPIQVVGFETNTSLTAGSLFGFEVFTTPGGSAGNQTNAGAWTSVATGTGTSAGDDGMSVIVLDAPFLLAANSLFGVAIVLDGPDGAADHQYTNGTGANQLYSNADLQLDFGSASNVPFTGGIFDPRVWNGTIEYNVGANVGRVPEPSTVSFLALGIAAVWLLRRKAKAAR